MISVDIEGVILSIPPNGYISILDKNVDDAIREIKRYTLGDKIRFNLRRSPADTEDTYAADIIFEQIAMHVQIDTLGSRQRYTK